MKQFFESGSRDQLELYWEPLEPFKVFYNIPISDPRTPPGWTDSILPQIINQKGDIYLLTETVMGSLN